MDQKDVPPGRSSWAKKISVFTKPPRLLIWAPSLSAKNVREQPEVLLPFKGPDPLADLI